MALGVMLKVVGEKQLMVFIGEVENLKMQKVRHRYTKIRFIHKITVPCLQSNLIPKICCVTD